VEDFKAPAFGSLVIQWKGGRLIVVLQLCSRKHNLSYVRAKVMWAPVRMVSAMALIVGVDTT